MCMSCWIQEYGAVAINNQKVREATKLIAEVYFFHDCGGGLHVLLDDWNLDFVDERYSGGDKEMGATPEQIEAEEKVLKAFRDMTIEERASALAAYNHYHL